MYNADYRRGPENGRRFLKQVLVFLSLSAALQGEGVVALEQFLAEH